MAEMSETKESEKKSGTPRGVLSNDEKIDVAERLKSEGNELVKAKKYKKAIVKYSQVFAYINGLDVLSSEVGHYGAALKRAPLTEAQKSKCAALRSASWSNIALCHIQLKNYEQALSFADKVLAADPDNVKSLFRKGQCLMELNDLDDAKTYLDRALKISPSDASVVSAMRRWKELRKEELKKQRSVFAGAFDKK